MKKSKIFLEHLRRYHNERNKAKVREFYVLPEELIFFPVTLNEHMFARFVLIEGRVGSVNLVTQSGKREIPEYECPVLERVGGE